MAARVRTADVLVVGGGIIGLAVAWRSAQRGLGVTVLDPDPGRGANQVAAGMLAPVTELQYGEEPLLRLGIASNERYAAFAAELSEAAGAGVGYRACGTLAVALDADDRSELRELHAFQQRLGLSSDWLTGRECRRLEPLLAPSVRGGLLVGGDHQVDGRRLGAALVAACERAGVRLHRSRGAELTLAPAADRATGARAEDGTVFAAGQTVLAAGSWSGELPGVPPELRLPVRPVKGQVLRLRMESPLGQPFLSRNVRALVRGGHLYLVPRADGELVVGATTEEQGFDTTVTAGGVYELLRDAHELVPGITELELVESSAGLRPGSPDNAPLLGPTALPGLVAATGHHRNGVLLTPVTADALAAYLGTGVLPPEAEPFSPARFAAPAAAAAPVPNRPAPSRPDPNRPDPNRPAQNRSARSQTPEAVR
ncbi:glycine oxidase ThiO [Streptacidiphilus sp. PB12-B1b]|uniref:glycine oxidase ThiO n=1 Tax=Streptacidiphilus sp. PB12-B1b TaxID=2705012 RepID=UPI0015FCE6D7|nr:glycine oxidase ThiO [Streptacidiphilus sp. PB12-B1b]QMU75889.1 glycine oxidase ThiO [Streptacidiphilus sp. PB12-B1b]